jgi:hypothetical protein
MDMNDRELTAVKLAEIERLIKEFKEKFEAGTSDADHFITMTEIERLWAELQNNTQIVYSDMIRELMGTVDEHDLIRKKKRVQTTGNKPPHSYKNPIVCCHDAWTDYVFALFADSTPRQQRKTSKVDRCQKHSAARLLSGLGRAAIQNHAARHAENSVLGSEPVFLSEGGGRHKRSDAFQGE